MVSAHTRVGTTPMFAVAPGGTQAVAWVSAPGGGTDGRLYVSVGGAPPSEIRDSLGPIEAHGEAPPKIAYGSDSGLYALYTVGRVVPGERFPQSALRLVRSGDAGRSWSAPVTVTEGSLFGSHSFHALHVDRQGTIYVSWLGRPPRGAPQRGGGREVSAAWLARSTDGGKTWSSRVRADSGEACPCCRTALATAPDGTLYMAWRSVAAGNIRDVVVARSADKGATWSEPVRAHADDWLFDGCPHAGPALAVDSAGTVHVAWWTGKEGNAGVLYAQSNDGARTFRRAVPLAIAPFSRPAHVQLGLGRAGKVVVAWDDGTKQVPQVLLRLSSDGGARFADAIPLSVAGRHASFPVLGVSGDSVSVAWSEQSHAAAHAAEVSTPNMRDPKAVMGLHAVGGAQVLVRRGAL